MINKIGLQTFTIRKSIKTPKSLVSTLKYYAGKGIKSFELARINFDTGELEALQNLKNSHGVTYSACQITLKKIKSQLDFLAEFAKKLDIKFIEVSVIPMKSFIAGKKGILSLSSELNELGKRLKEQGVGLLYHHHNFELIKFGGEISLDILLEHTDSRYVNLVCDTYWLAKSGYSPAEFIKKRMGRVKGIHLRDNIFKFKNGKFSSTDGVLDEGTIDYSFIRDLAAQSDVDFFSIEQDSKCPECDALKSYEYIKEIIE